jgi:hypothetical protein
MDKDMIDEFEGAEQFLQEQQRLRAKHAQNSSVISNPPTKSGEVAQEPSAAIVAPEE